ncbi:hypothetical protein AB0P40_39730 [Streptomyces sp. NPDC079189]|uniref:hypothetical protein n=1 Tax=Streptomyces sp. NPDC079189 TaxID=3154514 RepID=UPI003434A18A
MLHYLDGAVAQLGNLTTAGLAAAAVELDRPVREMGGTAREAAKAGAHTCCG